MAVMYYAAMISHLGLIRIFPSSMIKLIRGEINKDEKNQPIPLRFWLEANRATKIDNISQINIYNTSMRSFAA
jgi:hypothetical protein